MTDATYKIVYLTATPEEYEGEFEDWGEDIDYIRAVARFEGDQCVERIGTDGGEPEDQTLGRNWSWVARALNEAYRLGGERTVDDPA